MANPYLILWCDASSNKIYSGWQITTEATTPILKQGDNIGVEIHRVYRAQFGAPMTEIPFPPSATVRLAVGNIDSAPLDGTFNLTYGTSTTGDLAFDVTAAELDTALNALTDIIAEGGVSVTKNGNNFRIVWEDRDVFTNTFSAEIDALSPTSEASFTQVNAGSLTANRIILFKLRQSAIAATTSFTTTPPPAITITASELANTYRLDISPAAKNGVFTITMTGGVIPPAVAPFNVTSAPISVFDTPITIQNILGSLGVGTFSVSQVSTYSWEITTPSVVDTFTATSGLIGFSSVYGTLNMNTAEVEEFLSGSEVGEATLEVEVDIAGEIQTIIQTPVTIINDLIQTSSFTLVDLGSVMPVDSVVRYDTSQALTAPQQETARLNINAVSLAEVSATLNLLNMPTDNEKGAMQYSVLPSTSNPFVTMTERNPFDQELNTTDDVQFNTVTVGTASVVIDGTSVSVSNATDTFLIEPTGITFADGSEQTTAVDLTSQLFIGGSTPAGLKYINLDVSGFNNQPIIDIQESGVADTMRITGLGLRFPDGTTQTTAAAFDPALYLTKAGNLTGLASLSTSRTNLGLGSSDSVTFGTVAASSVNVSSSKVLINSNGVTFTSPAKIYFADGTNQSTAATGITPPTDTTLPYMVTWNGSSAFVCGGISGQLYLDNAGARQARYSSSLGQYSSGAIQITEDTWTSSMEINAKGLKFPDGTIQTTSAGQKQIVDYTAYDWQKVSVLGTSSITEIGVGKSLTCDATSTAASAWYGVQISNMGRALPYAGTSYRLVMHAYENHGIFEGLNTQAITSSFGMYKTQTLGGIHFGWQWGGSAGSDFIEIVYLNSSGTYTALPDTIYPPLWDTTNGWWIEATFDGRILIGNFETYADGYEVANDAKTNEFYPPSVTNYYIGGFGQVGAYHGQPNTFYCGQVYAIIG